MNIFNFCIIFIFTFVISYNVKNKNYLEEHIMEDIKERLAHILRAKNLTASQFAELMEIQPSNVSHLLNGRNKPSLDFLIKLKEIFPEYNYDWIINGKKPITINEPTPNPIINKDIEFDDDDKHVIEFDDIDEHVIEKKEKTSENKIISKILIIYSDNTFEVIMPNVN